MTESAGHEVPELEYDESVPPRPEEEIADAARSVPDPRRPRRHAGRPDDGARAALIRAPSQMRHPVDVLIQQVGENDWRSSGTSGCGPCARTPTSSAHRWRGRNGSSSRTGACACGRRPPGSPWTTTGVGRGIVTMLQEPGSPDDDRHVVSLWVAPESRRQGVGWALLDTVRRAAALEDARHGVAVAPGRQPRRRRPVRARRLHAHRRTPGGAARPVADGGAVRAGASHRLSGVHGSSHGVANGAMS